MEIIIVLKQSKMFEKDKSIQSQENSDLMDSQEMSVSAGGVNEGQTEAIKDGLWSQSEIFKFISYLVYNRQGLRLKLQRRTSKVFKQMALFIGTRSSVQCRSQNQRLFRKYKNIRNIVNSFKEQYGRERFDEDYARIALSPAIKFKTEYENYLENQSKKSTDATTQTEEIISFSPPNNYAANVSIGQMEFLQYFHHLAANWVFVPYCS